jgi:hypothetical protein
MSSMCTVFDSGRSELFYSSSTARRSIGACNLGYCSVNCVLRALAECFSPESKSTNGMRGVLERWPGAQSYAPRSGTLRYRQGAARRAYETIGNELISLAAAETTWSTPRSGAGRRDGFDIL